jgi:hypothetical protein
MKDAVLEPNPKTVFGRSIPKMEKPESARRRGVRQAGFI